MGSSFCEQNWLISNVHFHCRRIPILFLGREVLNKQTSISLMMFCQWRIATHCNVKLWLVGSQPLWISYMTAPGWQLGYWWRWDDDDKGESDDDRVDDEPPSHPSLTPAVSRWLAVLNKHRLSFCGATIIWQEDKLGEKKMKIVFSRHHDDMIRYTWAVASASYLANGEGSAKSKQRFWRTTDWLTHNIIQ